MDYNRFNNRINNNRSFFTKIRMCFDKKYQIEQQLIDLNSDLEYAKNHHQHDIYKEIIIEIIAISKNISSVKYIVSLFDRTAKYFKSVNRYDLSVLFYNKIINDYKTDILSYNEHMYLAHIHEELGDAYYEMQKYYESNDNYVRSLCYVQKNKYDLKIDSLHFKVAVIKILTFHFLDAIFIFEKLIFENSKYLTTNNNNYYITLIILCYLCLFEKNREPYFQINSIRKLLEDYKRKYIEYCETIEYVTLCNIISSVESLDISHFQLQAQDIIRHNKKNCLEYIYKIIFTHINKYINEKIELSNRMINFK